MQKIGQIIICGALIVLLSASCQKSKHIHSVQIQVLNALCSHYKSFEDSTAVYYKSSILKENEINLSNFKNKTHFNQVLSNIPKKDIKAWEKQLKSVRVVKWSDWGWEKPSFYTEKDYPGYFKYKGPPSPDSNHKTLTVYFFSIPLISSRYSLVKIGSKSGKNSWNVNIVILEKLKNGKWKILARENIFTS